MGSFNNYVTLRWVGGVGDFVTLRYGNSAWVGGVQALLLRNACFFHVYDVFTVFKSIFDIFPAK